MTYATLSHLQARFGEQLLVEITDRGEAATGSVDLTVVDRALSDTDAMINGYLGRYKLPLAVVPALLVDLAQVIAIYKLHRYTPNKKIEEDYKDALRILRDISTGLVRLSIEGAEPEGTGGNGVRITDRERPLTEANLKGYI